MASHGEAPGGLAAGMGRLGAAEVAAVRRVGEVARLGLGNLALVLTLRFRRRQFVEQLHSVGVRSLPIILVSAFFVGMVLAVQVQIELARFGVGIYIANIVTVTLLRELAPVFTGLLLAGRAGSGIAAEIGSMATTEQVLAMRMLALDVDRLVVAPRLAAGAAAGFALTLVFGVAGIVGGYVIAVGSLGIPYTTYHAYTLEALEVTDLACGLVKGTVFGAIVALAGSASGLAARGGARGVGAGTTRAVVAASLAILVSDFFLTRLLVWVLG
ncbi:MAG: ABC transporter permease [Planctomycetes bacterium]|nr:ABC transporter permease [Planctomycetota bacterium]